MTCQFPLGEEVLAIGFVLLGSVISKLMLVLTPLPSFLPRSKLCNMYEPQLPHQKNEDILTYSSELFYRLHGPVCVKDGVRDLTGSQEVIASGSEFSFPIMSKL